MTTLTRLLVFTALTLCAGSGISFAQEKPMTALRAMTNIPPERAAHIVRIEARDGSPAPERWYLISYDPQSESGFREYAVTPQGLAQERTVSQFVESASAEQVVPMPAIKLDSDQAYKQLEAYASAHGLHFSKVNYVLSKNGSSGAAPVWKLTCVDDAERPLATLTMTAAEGTVIAQTGFSSAPVIASDKPAKDAVTPQKLTANGSSEDSKPSAPRAAQNERSVTERARRDAEEKEPKVSATKPEPKQPQSAPAKRVTESKPRKPKADAQTADSGVRLQNFFTGRDPI